MMLMTDGGNDDSCDAIMHDAIEDGENVSFLNWLNLRLVAILGILLLSIHHSMLSILKMNFKQ